MRKKLKIPKIPKTAEQIEAFAKKIDWAPQGEVFSKFKYILENTKGDKGHQIIWRILDLKPKGNVNSAAGLLVIGGYLKTKLNVVTNVTTKWVFWSKKEIKTPLEIADSMKSKTLFKAVNAKEKTPRVYTGNKSFQPKNADTPPQSRTVTPAGNDSRPSSPPCLTEAKKDLRTPPQSRTVTPARNDSRPSSPPRLTGVTAAALNKDRRTPPLSRSTTPAVSDIDSSSPSRQPLTDEQKEGRRENPWSPARSTSVSSLSGALTPAYSSHYASFSPYQKEVREKSWLNRGDKWQ
jgi:hypothetical protein